MNTEKFLATAAVIVPVAHLIVCSVFLMGYAAGFGDNLASLISISDIFPVSLSIIGPIYVTGMLFPVLIIMYRHAGGTPYIQDAIEQIEDSDKRGLELSRHKRFLKFMYSLMILSFCFSMLAVVTSLIFEVRVPYGYFINNAPLWFFPVFIRMTQRFVGEKFTPFMVEISFVTTMLIVTALFVGLERGQYDRRGNFYNFTNNHFFCNRLIIVKSVSSNYIAILKNNQRVVVDADCKLKFIFRQLPPDVEKSGVELLFEKLFL